MSVKTSINTLENWLSVKLNMETAHDLMAELLVSAQGNMDMMSTAYSFKRENRKNCQLG